MRAAPWKTALLELKLVRPRNLDGTASKALLVDAALKAIGELP
jgi:hypothetical protein